MQKKYKCLYVYHLQCVVSNGNKSVACERMCKHWSCIKNKRKKLIKAVGINFSHFGIDEECNRLNTSSSVNLTFEVTNIPIIYQYLSNRFR